MDRSPAVRPRWHTEYLEEKRANSLAGRAAAAAPYVVAGVTAAAAAVGVARVIYAATHNHPTTHPAHGLRPFHNEPTQIFPPSNRAIDENDEIRNILVASTLTGVTIGAAIGSGIPIVGNAAGAVVGAAAGAIVGLIGSWVATQNNSNRR